MTERIITRRRFLGGAAALGAAGVLTAIDPRWVMAEDAPRPFGMAMHIHASFSEGTGSATGGASMLQQLTQASSTRSTSFGGRSTTGACPDTGSGRSCTSTH